MLSPHVQAHICGLDDASLIEYVHIGTSIYEPEAVEFARAELGRRGVSRVKQGEVLQDLKRQDAVSARNVHVSLTSGQFVLFTFLGLFDIVALPTTIILWAQYRQQGFQNKASQLWWCYWGAKLVWVLILIATISMAALGR